jgi:hypothetical protein
MKSNVFRNTIIAGILCTALVIPSFALGAKSDVTFGEMSALINNRSNAVTGELKSDNQTKAEEKFETKGSCEIKEDKVVFSFELVSHYTESKELKFGSGQQFEVIITDEEGKEVYRYSDGKFFTMALLFKRINPGESMKWQDEWNITNKEGEKITSGKYKAQISVLVITEEKDEKIEKDQLTTEIDFSLAGLEYEKIKRAVELFMPTGAEPAVPGWPEQVDSFVYVDLNNDGTDELAAFYKGQPGIGVILLEQNGPEWKLKDRIAGYGNSLDYAGFHDLNGDGWPEVLIGGEGYNRDKKLIIYKAEGEKYKELSSLDYADFSVGDMEGDGIPEIASILRTNGQIPSVKLQVHSIVDNLCKKEYETVFQHGDYPDAVIIGTVQENRQGIFVELGLGAHSAVTEIVVKENGEYKSVLAQEDEYSISQTFKPYPLFSRDINNDGIIEVGIQAAPPETEQFSMAETPWINKWYQWDGKDGLIQVMEEYSDYSEGYRFIVPRNWYGRYTIDKVTDEDYTVKSVHFMYLAENKEKAELLALHHIEKEDWPQREEEFLSNNQPYVLLGENGRNMLVAQLPQNSGMLSESSKKQYEEMILDKQRIISRFIACGDGTELMNGNQTGIIEPDLAREIIKETADEVINAVSIKDFETLSSFVHPEEGVRFTPYTNVSMESDIVFNKEEIRNFFTDQDTYLWGSFDGTGDEIRLTPGEYYERFIYSEDFLNAEQIGYSEVLSSGNMIENQFEVYENAIIVEYYFPGFNPDYAGMDWKSLRLVFQKCEDSWKLTGIIHNQWTI